MNVNFKEALIHAFPEMILYKDEPLKKYTYTETGGPADILAFPNTSAQVKALVDYCRNEDIPWIVLGNASNLIVRDRGIRGAVNAALRVPSDSAKCACAGVGYVSQADGRIPRYAIAV